MSNLGTVAALWRFPVKSMRGERLERLELEPRGAVGDRLWAVRDAAGKFGSGKTTRRFRRIEGLFGFRSWLGEGAPVVEFPGGAIFRGDDPAVHAALSEALGQEVTLSREADVSHFDAGPLHLITTASLRALGEPLQPGVVDPRRFRANLLIDAEGSGFAEDRWEGLELSVGSEVRLKIAGRTERCAMIGFAQDELADEPAVLREAVRLNGARIGVYAQVLVPGAIRVGDRVTSA